MKTTRGRRSSRAALSGELADLRVRMVEAEETLRAIRTGEVDAVVTAGKEGLQVFTLEGAGHAYRRLIESMNEGALTLTPDKMIVYANQCFAKMVRCPLRQVIGSSFRKFLSAEDRTVLRALLKRTGQSGAKIQLQLHTGDGSKLPVQISLRPTGKTGRPHATIGMVVTDLTETRRQEERLRALTHRVVQVQEDERARVALELHDRITQLHCAIVLRSQTLVDKLAVHGGALKREAEKLRELAGQAADEVERISHDLRPSVLDQLGLMAVLRATGREFAERTKMPVRLACPELPARLPADIELTLYRILQAALENIERHAHARRVTIGLTQEGATVRLTVADDGIGFSPDQPPTRRKGKRALGLLGMHERATYVGGILTLKSALRAGTEIEVRIPLPASAFVRASR